MRVGEGQDRPDPARGAPARRDLDDALRRALHAVADHVEPSDDGLTRILHRISTPSVVRQVTLLATDCVDLAQLITIWLEPAFTAAVRLTRRYRAGYRRGFSHPAAWARWRRAAPWLRPALAVASVATTVVIGVVVLGQVRQIVTRASLSTGTGASAPPHAGAHSAGGGPGHSAGGGPGHSAGGGPGHSPPANLTPIASARPGATSAQARRASHRPGTTPIPSPAITPSGLPAASPCQSPGPAPTPSTANHGHHHPHPGKTKPAPPLHMGHGGS
jgi:hypothetical protein